MLVVSAAIAIAFLIPTHSLRQPSYTNWIVPWTDLNKMNILFEVWNVYNFKADGMACMETKSAILYLVDEGRLQCGK